MDELRDLPQSELEVMKVLWDKGEATVRQVYEERSRKHKLAYKTVGTLLMRLREKGYVEAEERDFAYVFRPLVPREQVVLRKVDDLVHKVLGGDMAELMLYMVRNGEKLTPQQIDELEAVLKAAKEREAKDV